jgi:large subunit ribosomal protein L31e
VRKNKMTQLERNYTIPLRRDFVKVPRQARSKRAISFVKKFITRHMKSEDVRIGKHLNEYIWQNGIRNPPGKVTILAIKNDDYVTVELAGKDYVVDKVQLQANEAPTGLKGKLQEALKTTKEKKSEEDVEAKEEKPKKTSPKKEVKEE